MTRAFTPSRFMQSAVLCLLAFGILATNVGCGTGSRLPSGETGTVSGKLSYKGSPVPKGTTIMFMADQSGIVGSATVDERGEYALRMKEGLSVLCGVYRISVGPPNPTVGMSTEDLMRTSTEKGKKSPDEALKQIPERYRSPEKSNTLFEVKPGPNTFDLDMKD